jgi:hypothetical protein
MKNKTTIAIPESMRNRLFRLKQTPDESYKDVLEVLIAESKGCDLCNQDKKIIDGTFVHGSTSGPVELCNNCWTKLDEVDDGCSLCRIELLEDTSCKSTITENKPQGRGGCVCDDCRRILDFNA